MQREKAANKQDTCGSSKCHAPRRECRDRKKNGTRRQPPKEDGDQGGGHAFWHGALLPNGRKANFGRQRMLLWPAEKQLGKDRRRRNAETDPTQPAANAALPARIAHFLRYLQ